MPRFARVLNSVLQQVTPWSFDVIVIDSGSKDGTVAYAEAQPGVRVISIPSAEFGHGRTRNRAIAETAAPFVALLTHDAEPVNVEWLARLVAAVEQDGRVAGAFGRHIAYPEASPFTKRDLEQHFAGFLQHPPVVHKDLDPNRFEHDVGWRQFLHFYSDNNSCLRRSVWERIPYPDVEFAEDQIWAKQIIEEGYSKAYAPHAVVYHSHDYSLIERMQRSFDEARNFQCYFGYRLAPTLRGGLRSIVGRSLNDIRYTRQTDEIDIGIYEIVRQVLMNSMIVIGHYIGTHHDKIPEYWQMRLSRDNNIFIK